MKIATIVSQARQRGRLPQGQQRMKAHRSENGTSGLAK